MTEVRVDLRTDAGTVALAPLVARIRCTPTADRLEADHVVVDEGFTRPLVDGVATVQLAPSEATWCWLLEALNVNGVVLYQRYVAVPDSATAVEFSTLTEIDPDTLEATADPEDAWWVALDDVDDRVTILEAAESGGAAFKEVTNNTGAAIPAGTLVEIDGAFGVFSTVRVADNATADHVAGITVAEIADGASGNIQVTGTVEGLDTSAFTAGAPLYLGTAGAWTQTRPAAPAHIIRVGVAGVTHPTAGTVVFTLPSFEILAENVDGLDAKVTELAEDPTSDLGVSLSSRVSDTPHPCGWGVFRRTVTPPTERARPVLVTPNGL